MRAGTCLTRGSSTARLSECSVDPACIGLWEGGSWRVSWPPMPGVAAVISPTRHDSRVAVTTCHVQIDGRAATGGSRLVNQEPRSAIVGHSSKIRKSRTFPHTFPFSFEAVPAVATLARSAPWWAVDPESGGKGRRVGSRGFLGPIELGASALPCPVSTPPARGKGTKDSRPSSDGA